MEKIIVKLNGEIRIEKKDKTLEITLSPIQENKADELAKELSKIFSFKSGTYEGSHVGKGELKIDEIKID